MIDKDKENKTKELETEQKIIHLLLRFRRAIDDCMDNLSIDLFDKSHHHLIRSIYKDFLNSNRQRLLNREGYKKIVLESSEKQNLMHYLQIYDICLLGVFADINDLNYLKRDLLENYSAKQSYEYLKVFHDDVKSKGYQYAAKNLLDNFQNVVSSSESQEVIFGSIKDFKDRYLELIKHAKSNPESIVRCGIPEIDDDVNVGFKAGHMTLFVAPPANHKTDLMLNIALNLSDRGHQVLFVPVEMSWDDLLSRVVCNRVGIPNVRLYRPQELTEEDMKKIENAKIWADENSSMFMIMDSKSRLSAKRLHREIQKRISIYKPKIVIIDYADILETDSRYESRTVEIGEMIKSIRQMGRKYSFHVMSAAQMNRSAIKALREGNESAVDSTSIHGSQSYASDTDTVFGLIKVPGESNRLKVINIKARYGQGGRTHELNVDAARCLISSMTGGPLTSETDLELDMNRLPSEISAALDNPPIDFVSSDLNDDDISSL